MPRKFKAESRSKSPLPRTPSGKSSKQLASGLAGDLLVTQCDEGAGKGAEIKFNVSSTGIQSRPSTLRRISGAPVELLSKEGLLHAVLRLAKAVFLPDGYPSSVSGDYVEYQIWDTLQAFCSTVMGTLATKALLTSMGVGNQDAAVTAALWQTTIRRNIGKIARIAFTAFRGTDLDNNSKLWRIVADVLNDIAMALMIVSPFLCGAAAPLSPAPAAEPDEEAPAKGQIMRSAYAYFASAAEAMVEYVATGGGSGEAAGTKDCNTQWSVFMVICAAEVCQAVVGVAGGASRAALTQHFSKRDNYGDVQAKDGNQEVFVEIVGSVVGMWFTWFVSESDMLAGVFFLVFATLHGLALHSLDVSA